MTRHVLEVDDLTVDELSRVLDLSERATWPRPLDGPGRCSRLRKPSARTRNATEMAVVQLGGHPLTMRGDEVGFDVRESVEDIARTLSCYHSAIAARVYDHAVVQRLAQCIVGAGDQLAVRSVTSDAGARRSVDDAPRTRATRRAHAGVHR